MRDCLLYTIPTKKTEQITIEGSVFGLFLVISEVKTVKAAIFKIRVFWVISMYSVTLFLILDYLMKACA